MVKIYEEPSTRHVPNGGPHLIESAAADEATLFSAKAMEDIEIEHNTHQNGEKIKSEQTFQAKKGGDLPEANLELVQELRTCLGKDYEENEKSSEIYSKAHYEEIMNPNSPNTCWRYLLQRDQDVAAALDLVKATLVWRKENRIDELTASDMVKDFWLRAPIGVTGRTRNGNDLIYAVGKNFRKPDASVKQVIRDFIGFILFDWDRQHQHDLNQLEIVFDVSDTGFRNIDLEFSQWLVSIRDFVPARIKALYIVGIPFLIRPVIRLIISWLPERFKRIAYCGSYDELVRSNVDDEFIPEEIGGKSDSRWRLAPIGTKWVHELDTPDADEMFEKICKACSFGTSQELLDKLYKMQRDYERSLNSKEIIA